VRLDEFSKVMHSFEIFWERKTRCFPIKTRNQGPTGIGLSPTQSRTIVSLDVLGDFSFEFIPADRHFGHFPTLKAASIPSKPSLAGRRRPVVWDGRMSLEP